MLRALFLLPIVGAVIIALLPGSNPRLIRFAALLASGAAMGLAWGLLGVFDPALAGVQLFETHVWNPRLGSAFSLGVDGFSFPMVLLGTLLTVVTILASNCITKRVKGYYALILLLESGMLGVFMARDWSLFYVFWELTLIPLFFLIDRWGSENKHRAALNFVLYTMGGSVFMLVALLLLYDANPGHSFDVASIAQGARSLSQEAQILIFLGLLIGFGVKVPIFPLHGWLPLAYVEAPSPIPILLSGILAKMGSYGLIRAAEMLPLAVQALQGWLAALGMISMIYGGVLAWHQRDLKKMVAYSSMSHMGVVLLGIATLNEAGLTGAVMQMVAHGLVAGSLFLLIGLLYERTNTRDIAEFSSLVQVMPRFAFFTVLALVAAVGFPGTAGFIAEVHVLIGGFARWSGWVIILSMSVLISAAYAFRTVGRLFTGPVREEMRLIPDLGRAEFAAVSVLASGILLVGIFPTTVLGLISASVRQLSKVFG
ncbi:MAG: NADH-quinone oxidoreductase subunit M [Gammaproteobacteria bacterium]|nr:NADH-quinone oxidoreductase subunit M [Gammaproteobacteria bacterium]MBU1731838.1 NADH-quinone oxidoreductase subunit M [Gammaproteobacteria bacterium]MBU1892449.1 NADH-quinone oxidoreductase subunit M [Gammaproteobacteria bacterium]